MANDADEPAWDSYKPTAPDGWVKPLPTDPTSPHWYDERALARLVFAHIAAARHGGRDLPLGEFVRGFKGLTGTAKAKTVLAALPAIKRLSDFERNTDAVAALLTAMRHAAQAPKPAALGGVDEAHYRSRLDDVFGVQRFWFKRAAFTSTTGIPWIAEVAVAETVGGGGVHYAVNYSPTFADPLAQTMLRGPEFATTGAASFLTQADANPSAYDADPDRAVVVHLICPAPEFLDKGKTTLKVAPDVAERISTTLWAATKTLYKEKKRRARDARALARALETNRAPTRVNLKEAVFRVMPEAITATSGDGAFPFPTRNLFYEVRRLIQQYTDAELKGTYFSQNLVVEYERQHGRIPGHYRDPRGELHEPHTGKVVRLGTREVADYALPEHVFNKILYVEKEGFEPIFEAAQLAERFDLAIAYGKGQPVEAVRALFERANAGAYRLFVLHDADPSGYSIARTMSEETARMPDYSVDVVDLGLSVSDAIEHGLGTEQFTRRRELPWWMPERLTEQERVWFEGRRITPDWAKDQQWECTRVELNAFTAPDLIAYIEAGLNAAGATGKLVPPPDVLTDTARRSHRQVMGEWVDARIAELFDTGQLTDQLAAEYETVVITDPAGWVATRHADDQSTWWRQAIDAAIRARLAEVDDRLRDRLDELLNIGNQ